MPTPVSRKPTRADLESLARQLAAVDRHLGSLQDHLVKVGRPAEAAAIRTDLESVHAAQAILGRYARP